jgi:LysM repeat protein
LDEEKEPYIVQGVSRDKALDYSGAIESYHRALEVNPRNSIAHYRLGLLYMKDDRDPAAAIYHLQRFLKLRPQSEKAAPITQRIIGCKQALARDVALGPVSGEMQQRIEELLRSNQQLSEEHQRLEQENRMLRDQLARLQGSPSPTASSTVTRTPAPSGSPPPSGTPVPSGRTTHTVQRGETYYSIAGRYGISPDALQAANPGIPPRQLKIGQKLVVPVR